MPLTEEQLKEINAFYDLPNHGFLRGLPGINSSKLFGLKRHEYAELWATPFKEYLDYIQSEGFDIQKSLNLDDIFRAVLEFNPSYKMQGIALKRLAKRKFGDLLMNREKIVLSLQREEKEIYEDYMENYGQKKDNFLKAVRYISDGHEIEFFFRYWRRPLKELLVDRKVNLRTIEGKNTATEILRDLFGSEYINYDIMKLLQKTPEQLIEQKKEIEEKRRELLRNREAEKKLLFDKPFFETLEKFIGIRFIDTSDVDLMASQVCNRPDAHEKLKELIKTDETFDKNIFIEVLKETPRNISHQADQFILSLRERRDNEYLEAHPIITFGAFLAARRSQMIEGTLEGEEIKKKALQFILGTTYPVDNKAVQEAKDVPCYELNRNCEQIIKNIRSRRVKKFIAVSATLSGLMALVAWLGYGTVKGINQVGQKTTPIVQNTVKKVQEAFSQKEQTKNAERTPRPKKDLRKKIKQSVAVKGNRLILGNWQAWVDSQCTRTATGMFQQLFISEFNFMMDRIRKTGKPLYPAVDVENAGHAVMNNGNLITTKALEGDTPVQFYVNVWSRDAQHLKNDVVNYHKNIKDVLENLPGDSGKTAEKQLLAMEAIGPSMGWSVKQQRLLQERNPKFAREIQYLITQKAKNILIKQKGASEDIDAVFTAVMKATKSCRYIYPECNFYLLSADSAIRHIAGIEKTDTKQLDEPINNVVQKGSNESESPRKCPSQKESKYKWFWIVAGTVALTSYLGSEYWKGKAEIVK